jgi:hypothetical protein
MYVCNDYVGGQEYIVTFKGGQHHLIEVIPDCYELPNRTIFSGHYDQCMARLDEMHRGYAESCMT